LVELKVKYWTTAKGGCVKNKIWKWMNLTKKEKGKEEKERMLKMSLKSSA
jgi:hypothetical protein